MPRVIAPLVLSPDERSELQRWVVALGTPQQVALRCRIVLAVAAGKTEMAIAADHGVNRKTVRLSGVAITSSHIVARHSNCHGIRDSWRNSPTWSVFI